MKLSDFLQDIGRPVAYYPSLARLLGGVKEAVFLSQFIYWTGREKSQDGWIFKSSDEVELETGLSYREQLTARKRLKSLGILKERYARLEHILYFKIDFDALNDRWTRRNTQNAFPEIPKTRFGKYPKRISIPIDYGKDYTEITKHQGVKSRFYSSAPLSLEDFLLKEKNTYDSYAVGAVNIFLEYYERVFQEPHPRLKPEQWRSVLDTILECTDCHGRTHYLNSGDLEHMIAVYFTTRFQEGCDYSILHFNTDGVKSNRYFETCFGGRGDEIAV